MNIGQVLETHLGWAANRLGFRALTPVFDGADEAEIEAELARAWMVDQAWMEIGEKAWEWMAGQEYSPDSIRDDDEVRMLYLEQWLGERGYQVYNLTETPNYARRALRENGCATKVMSRMISWLSKRRRSRSVSWIYKTGLR